MHCVLFCFVISLRSLQLCASSSIGCAPSTHRIEARFDECVPLPNANYTAYLPAPEQHLRPTATQSLYGVPRGPSVGEGAARKSKRRGSRARRRDDTTRVCGSLGPTASTGFGARLSVQFSCTCFVGDIRTGRATHSLWREREPDQ